MGIDEVKRAQRKRFRNIRKELGAEERSRIDALITERLIALPEYQDAQLVLPYLCFGAEVDTRALIRHAWAAGKTVALPWCVPGTREMRWYRVESFDSLVRSSFGVEEPVPRDEDEQDPNADGPAIALVPGLTFDERGYRMGYGGGFYDTLLSTFDGAAVGLCREAQFEEDLTALGVIDAHDRSCDVVVTEARVIRPS